MFWFEVDDDDAFVSKLFYHSLFTLCVSVPFYVSFCPHRIIITIPSTTTEFDEVVMEGLAFFSVNISTGRLKVNNLPMFVVVDLLEHGDLFSQFIDTAEDKLRKEVREVSLLELTVQTTTLTTDAHKEDLRYSLASYNFIQHLNLIQVI